LRRLPKRARKLRRWNAVDNFCKPFDFVDPDKTLTGIAFLIVCDMLLTGFDAPVEQVMYIDKRLYEHNLLQAIARVNRVATGKAARVHRGLHRLANHLGSGAGDLYGAKTRRISDKV
jgi:type I restriction enzyme R subunit